MSQTPCQYHADIYKGESWTKTFRVYDRSATTGLKTLRSLSGYTGSFTVVDIDGDAPILNFGVAAGSTLAFTSGTSDDHVTATLTSVVTAALTAGTYNLLITLTVGGATLRYAEGTMTVHP